MPQVLRDLFVSKKFIAALSAVAIYLAGRFGFALDPNVLDHIFAAFLVYVGAQGIADNGKSAAQIMASPSAPPKPVVVINASPTTMSAGVLSVMALVVGLGSVTACTAATRAQVTAGIGALIDCEADNLRTGVGELVPLATQAVMAAISGDGKHVDTTAVRAAAHGMSSDLARCALATAFAVLATPPPAKPGAPSASGLTINGPALHAAFESIRGELGGANFKTSAGVI